MKITVTGGSGFVGSHIADQFSKNGHEVTIFDKKESLWLRKDQKIIIGDLQNESDLKKAIYNANVVCHFAALSDIEDALNKPIETVNENILGGWKYINNETGEFFTDENDLGPAVEKIMKKIENNKYQPRNFFVKNYSVINSGRRLKTFLYDNYGPRINIDQKNVDYITIESSKTNFKQCDPVYS